MFTSNKTSKTNNTHTQRAKGERVRGRHTLVMMYRPQMLHTFTSCTRRHNTQYALIVILMIKMETNYILVARAKQREREEREREKEGRVKRQQGRAIKTNNKQ